MRSGGCGGGVVCVEKKRNRNLIKKSLGVGKQLSFKNKGGNFQFLLPTPRRKKRENFFSGFRIFGWLGSHRTCFETPTTQKKPDSCFPQGSFSPGSQIFFEKSWCGKGRKWSCLRPLPRQKYAFLRRAYCVHGWKSWLFLSFFRAVPKSLFG